MDPRNFRKGEINIRVNSYSYDDENNSYRDFFGAKRVSVNTSIVKNLGQFYDDVLDRRVTAILPDKNAARFTVSSGDSTKFKTVGVVSKSYFDDPFPSLTGENFSYNLIENPEIFSIPLPPNPTGSGTIFNSDYVDLSPDRRSFLENREILSPSTNPFTAAQFVRHNGAAGQTSYFFNVGVNDAPEFKKPLDSSSSSFNSRINLDFYPLDFENFPFEGKVSNSGAHLTYDVRGGTNTKNCFAVGFEVIDYIKLDGYFFDEEDRDLINSLFYPPILGVDPIVYHGDWNYTENYERLCSVRGGCDPSESKDPPLIIECWTGNDITGQEYRDWVTDLRIKWMDDFFNTSFRRESNTQFFMSGVETLFTSWTGFIVFMDFASGDKVNFKPYNFKKTGASPGDVQFLSYESVYEEFFLNEPPFGEPNSFSLEFLKDFNSPETLVSSLNDKFIQTGRLFSGFYSPTNGVQSHGNKIGGIAGYNGFSLNSCSLSPNTSSFSKGGDITYGPMSPEMGIPGSGFRGANQPSLAKWTDDLLFSPSSPGFSMSRSCISWRNNSSGGFFKLNGMISEVFGSGFNNCSFKIIKSHDKNNSFSNIYPVDNSFVSISNFTAGVSLDRLNIFTFLESGDSFDIVFNPGDASQVSGLWVRPEVQRLDRISSRRSNRISLAEEARKKSSKFYLSFSGFFEDSSPNTFYLDNSIGINDTYGIPGYYSGTQSEFAGYFENSSFVDYNTHIARGGQVFLSDFSGKISYEMRIDRGMNFLALPRFSQSVKNLNSNINFDYFVRKNSNVLKSGLFIDKFSSSNILASSDTKYSGVYITGETNLNYGDKLFFGFGKKSQGILDVNFDVRINLLSGRVSESPNPIWYPYDCPTGWGQKGIYISTTEFPLAEAEICDECIDFLYGASGEPADSGLKNILSGRVIKITSNHFNSGGYALDYSKNEDARNLLKEAKKDKIKFLLPSGAILKGSNDGVNWTDLGSFTDVEWSGLKPFSISLTGSPEEQEGLDIPPLQRMEVNLEVEELLSYISFPQGTYQKLFDLSQTKYTPAKEAFCPPVVSDRFGRAVWPVGWPESAYGFDEDGKKMHPCDIKEVEMALINCPERCEMCGCTDIYALNYNPNADCPCLDENGELNGCCQYPKTEGRDVEKPPVYELFFLRTGFLLDYVQDGFFNGPEDVQFNYYKLDFEGFAPNLSGLSESVVSSGFYFKNIDLFGAKSAVGSPLTGDPICIIGADYHVDIFGNVPVRITGIFEQDIVSENSGVVSYENALMEGLISGLKKDDWVLFHKESGRLVSDSGSGFFSGDIYMTGVFSSGIEGWFYDPVSTDVSFFNQINVGIFNSGEENIPDGLNHVFFNTSSGGGSGYFTGDFTVIKDRVVNTAIAVGGFLNPEIEIEGIGPGLLSGLIKGGEYKDIASGFFDLSFTITGESENGYFSTGFATGGDIPSIINYLYDPLEVSRASGRVQLNNLINFDYISINNQVIRFSTNPSSSFSAPEYFFDFSGLVDIISGNRNLFMCDIVDIDYLSSGFTLISDLSGDLGNSQDFSTNNLSRISLTPDLGFFSGGLSQYQTLEGVRPYPFNTPIEYSFEKEYIVAATGYYEGVSGSGSLRGPIFSYRGKRDFDTVWSFRTGDDYSLMEFDDLLKAYSGNIDSESGNILPSVLRTRILYRNLFNDSNPDVAKLKIYDNNYESGIEIEISGRK